MNFTENNLKRIIREGKDTELWKAIVQIIEGERQDIQDKIDDLDNYPDIDRMEMIKHRNYLKWFIGLPERMVEKPEVLSENASHLMTNLANDK